MPVRITREEIERRIYVAAQRKAPTGSRRTSGTLLRRRGGVLVRSGSLRDARNALLRDIGDEIVDEAKRLYSQRPRFDDPRYLTNSGRTKDPRVIDTAGKTDYLNSFDVTPLPGGAKPGIRVTNKASVTKYDPYDSRKKTYRYGDVSEWGRPPLVSNDRMFKIGLRTRYAESLIKKKKGRGKKTALRKTSIYNPDTGSFVKYDDLLGKYYQYTYEVPGIDGNGIIAKAVDIVLGKFAGNEVRRRT